MENPRLMNDLRGGDPVEPSAFVFRVCARGDPLWPGRFHETKGTDGNGGTARNRLTGLLPARTLCLGSERQPQTPASTLPPVQRKTARVFSQSSRGLRARAPRRLERI